MKKEHALWEIGCRRKPCHECSHAYKAFLIPFLISLLVAEGCARYHSVGIGAIEEVAVEIRGKSEGNTVQLGMLDGAEHFGSNLEIGPDSTSIFHTTASRRIEFSNEDIKHIVIVDRRSGGIKGLKVGFILGFITAAFTYYMVEDLFNEDGDRDWPLVMGFGLYGGVAGGFVCGLPIGWLIGSRDIYRLERAGQR